MKDNSPYDYALLPDGRFVCGDRMTGRTVRLSSNGVNALRKELGCTLDKIASICMEDANNWPAYSLMVAAFQRMDAANWAVIHEAHSKPSVSHKSTIMPTPTIEIPMPEGVATPKPTETRQRWKVAEDALWQDSGRKTLKQRWEAALKAIDDYDSAESARGQQEAAWVVARGLKMSINEWETLRRAAGLTITIEGPRGSGKTRVGNALLDLLPHLGFTTKLFDASETSEERGGITTGPTATIITKQS